MRLYALLAVAARWWGARAQRPIAGVGACPSGARRVLVYRRNGADAGANVTQARHGAWIKNIAALSDSFGRPPAAGDASDYCSNLPCVIRTRDAHVAELVTRCRPPYEYQVVDTVRHVVSSNNQDNKPEGIMFMVMGKAGSFQPWWDLAQQVNTSITLVYASYDVPVDTTAINSMSCQSIFIPHTSWTEGRNLLAENALRRESQRGKQFDFWAFGDDDIQLLCHEGASQLDCWNLLLNFMAKDMPKQAAMVGLGFKAQNYNPPAYVSVTTVDAIFNAFKREYVPFLLPYVTLAPGQSWWDSQGALFQIQIGCFRHAVVSPPVAVLNEVHRKYPRGLNGHRLIQTLHENYDSYAKELDFIYRADLQQYRDFMSFASAEALSEHLPVLNFTACSPLSQRFREWKANITLEGAAKARSTLL